KCTVSDIAPISCTVPGDPRLDPPLTPTLPRVRFLNPPLFCRSRTIGTAGGGPAFLQWAPHATALNCATAPYPLLASRVMGFWIVITWCHWAPAEATRGLSHFHNLTGG